ncbi:hypothetical protein ONO23_01396 [Micromonospora noduli]|uniref:DUF3592 domain-containing protein n=1 Tax=Micromonospora noduli TaxID=709876 RepID=A0A328N8M9_9ACTN|nr:MFS transporter [Micromonospora noduli]RAO05395.1 hypothetical protein LAH08_00853 [Micromonospora noduli]RAO22791.1 hypothetical protein MED15_01641 [Micromonospora noduli]RAO23254.1 hypothetical protein LUPAC07_00418 [Micromonospora noduli]RAO28425.1 hypothetical protein ONO86_05962 [Micromonospora noduli]RAO37205.1 hypothetical protein ONO23_01396 [Micromonospora noduli]
MSIRNFRLVNQLGAAYLAVLTVVSGLGGALVATTWIRADVAALPGTILWCLALMAAALVTAPAQPLRMGLLCLAWLLSGLLMFASAMGFYTAVLEARGKRVEATVTQVRDGREKGRHLYYALADLEGTRIPGELSVWPGAEIGASHNPEGEVGARVTVIRDPEGLVDPRLPDDVDGSVAVPIWLVVFTMTAVACMLAGRPLRAKPVVRRPRETSETGRGRARRRRRKRRLRQS